MVSSVGSIARVVALLQQNVTATKPGQRVGTSISRSAFEANPAASTSFTHLQLAGRRIAAVSRDAPDRRRKVLYIFVEVMLQHQFGDSSILSPEFSALVHRCVSAIDTDPELVGMVDEALSELGCQT